MSSIQFWRNFVGFAIRCIFGGVTISALTLTPVYFGFWLLVWIRPQHELFSFWTWTCISIAAGAGFGMLSIFAYTIQTRREKFDVNRFARTRERVFRVNSATTRGLSERIALELQASGYVNIETPENGIIAAAWPIIGKRYRGDPKPPYERRVQILVPKENTRNSRLLTFRVLMDNQKQVGDLNFISRKLEAKFYRSIRDILDPE